MAVASQFQIVFVMCGSAGEARKIAKSLVGKRLAACVNIVGGTVESIYQWKGRIEKAKERLLIIKTSTKRLKQVEAEVLRLHSYETPEFLAVSIGSGSKKYMDWLKTSVD